jgi:Domain of unknown function (DUF4347)/RTX calcium-binding nonapeptide repeat (4 copies)
MSHPRLQSSRSKQVAIKEVLFIDRGIEDYQILIDSTRPGVAVHLLNRHSDGVLQLSEILLQYTNLEAIHIVSHGTTGCLILGNSLLSATTLGKYQHNLFSWQASLKQGADILIYGCNVGKGTQGACFIQQLADITGVSIAASSSLTGNSEQGGNWALNVTTSEILADFVFRKEGLVHFSSILATNILDFTNDTVTNFVTATHPTTNFGTINLKIVKDVNSTGTANASLTLALTGSVDDTFDDFFYGGGSDGEYLVIYTDGREVDFQSIGFGSSNSSTFTSLTVYAYRDAALLGSQTFSPSGASFPNDTLNTETITFTSSIFDNADEIRLIGVDGVNVDVVNTLIDNVVIADAIADPAITSATYDASTNMLVVTGINMLATGGAVNDIDVSKLTLTGEGGTTYTLTSSNVEIDSATQFTVTLNTVDQINVEGLWNKNGTSSVGAVTYNIAAAANWNPAQAGHADLTGNGITVSNVQIPIITSATYDVNTGVLTITGTNLVKASGASNDITASKFTLTGEGGSTYTLTDTANVEITDGTSFSLTLSANDKAAINQFINKNGTSSTGGTTYNLAAADDWNTVVGNTDISDVTGNGITVSNVAVPAITSATYDTSTGTLTVTGTNFLKSGGATNDIVANRFSLTGEGGETYTLTDTANVETTSGTAFTLTLSATDRTAVNQIINKNGTSSTGGTTFNLAAAEDWAAGADAAVNVADTTGNGITVSNVAVPAITSATYDTSTGALTVTGTNFLKSGGAANDIVANRFTLTGEGGETYTLTDTANVETTSGTAFTLTLSATDRTAVNQIINKNGTSSTGGTTFNLAAAEDWAAGADAAVNVADTTGNGITVSNVAVPAITSATYDTSTGALTVTGTNFLKSGGAANDIVANRFTLTGEGGETYTLTDTANVETTSGTAFTLTLSATDRTAVNQIINKNGTSSTGGTTFNLAAAEDWAAGADAAVNVADTTGNGITVSNVAVPSITSATYDYSTNTLTVTGTGFLKQAGATNDIDVSRFTFTGEDGATYTLASTADVEIDSDTQFTINLSGADLFNVEALLNKNGTSADDGTTYNLAAAEDWATGADAAINVVDATGNGITVANYAAPTITSATYDVSTGQLVITGDNLVNLTGASNDLDASLLAFTGDGGSYTLTDTGDIDITSATSATLVLSTTDQLNVHGLLNKNGTASGGAITYNLAAADNWMSGAPAATAIADLAGNGITVSNVQIPTITSAVYDSDLGVLVVTGTHLFRRSGTNNDVDISTLTFTGGVANATYTLASISDVEITSATSFSVTLAGVDKVNVDALLDQLGTVSSGGSTYNLAAADNWLTAADAAIDISDAVNTITVSINPKITSATYNASTGTLVVTGANIQANGGGSDIDVSGLTLTGEGGATYTLTDTADVERDSLSQFTVTLSVTDKAAVNQIFNKNGALSTGGTNYNLAAADDWNTNITAGDTSDTIGNSITVSNVSAPAITSATYNAGTGILAITGTNFPALSGAANDIIANKFTITGEGGDTYTLTDTANIDIISSTDFTLALSVTDKAAVNQIINKDGTTSTGGTIYNLAAAEDWAAGTDTAINVIDATGNGITASSITAPAIISATYSTGTGVLTVTGTGFLKFAGADNDIDASMFTFTGLGGGTYTLTDTADVDITSATAFSLTLSATDKTAVNTLLNASGTTASDATAYNLAAAEDWSTGADTATTIADVSGNGITVTTPAPAGGGGGGSGNGSGGTGGGGNSGGGGGTGTTTKTIDGITVSTRTEADGSITLTLPVVDNTRIDDPDTPSRAHADIPVIVNNSNDTILTVSLPVGTGFTANGANATNIQNAANNLIQRIAQITTADSDTTREMVAQGEAFIAALAAEEVVAVQTLTLAASDEYVPEIPIIITGSSFPGSDKLALIIDASALPSGTIIQLDNIDFAVITGTVRVIGGAGNNFVILNEQEQTVILGAGDDILFGGAGDDTIGSLDGDDQVSGGAGDDTVYGGTGHDLLTGSAGNDALNGGFGFDAAVQAGALLDYQITINRNQVTLTHQNGEADTLVDVELIQFETGSSLAIAHSAAEAAAHHLVKTWLGRDLTVAEGSAVQNWSGASNNDIVHAFLSLPETINLRSMTPETLLAGLPDNPNIIQLNSVRGITGDDNDNQGYLSLSLALHADGRGGHDVLRIRGNRDDVHFEQIDNGLEITRLEDGAMLRLSNVEMIAFDSGENILLAHSSVEGILGRLFQTFFDRNATIDEWQLGREALSHGISPDVILDWFQAHANVAAQSDTDYIQTLYMQALGRTATETELHAQQSRLENNEITRNWLAVDIASSDAAITTVGSVLLLDGGL